MLDNKQIKVAIKAMIMNKIGDCFLFICFNINMRMHIVVFDLYTIRFNYV